MMNPISMMRLLKRMNPENSGTREQYTQDFSDEPEIGQPEQPNEESEVNSLMQEGPGLRELRDFSSKGPKPEDYKPSTGRKLASVLLAAAQGFTGGAEKGVKLGQDIQNAPWERAKEDFTFKKHQLGDIAALEEKDQGRKVRLFGAKQTSRDKASALAERSQDRKLTREQIAANQALLEDDRKQDNIRADRALEEGHKDREASRADRRSFHEDAMALGNRNATTAEERAKHIGIKDKTPQLDRLSQQFDNHPLTKKYNVMQDAHQFVNSLDPKTTNPGDDQALIYSFAKAMDPDSAVREGEYKTVQKYSQSWLSSMGFNAERIINGSEFLTPEARKNLKTTIETKFNALKKQHDNLASEFGRKIDRHTGGNDGRDYLTNYDVASENPDDKYAAWKKAHGIQ